MDKNVVQINQSYAQIIDAFSLPGQNNQKNKWDQNYNIQPQQQLVPMIQRHSRPQLSRINMESWEQSQIEKVFRLYESYGSQWKIISERFPTRSTNSIKNRFYTVVRNFLKDIFYYNPVLPIKLPTQISSKIILLFYEGKGDFQPFKGFGKQLMREINYTVTKQSTRRLSEKYSNEIKNIYNIIFDPIALQESNRNSHINQEREPPQTNSVREQQVGDNNQNGVSMITYYSMTEGQASNYWNSNQQVDSSFRFFLVPVSTCFIIEQPNQFHSSIQG